MPVKAIDEVLREHTKALMSISGVVGTGQGVLKGKPCIKVFVIKRSPGPDMKIPDYLEGYPVVIEEVGEIRPLPQK